MPNPFGRQSVDKAIKDNPMPQAMAGLGAPPGPMYPSDISPEQLALMGGVADSVGTYGFLKRGVASEGNPMFSGLHNNPLATGLGVAGLSAGLYGARKLIGKKWPKVASALAANQGAEQLAMSAASVNASPRMVSGDDQWKNALSGYRNRGK